MSEGKHTCGQCKWQGMLRCRRNNVTYPQDDYPAGKCFELKPEAGEQPTGGFSVGRPAV